MTCPPHPHPPKKPWNKQINIKAFARNQCSTHSTVHDPMSLLSYNMKFLVSCSHHSASKTPFAFMDFLLAPCICVSCFCLEEMGSLFIVFIHFICSTVLTEGLWNQSHSHRNDLLWAGRTVR